jgi:hypothetical protein
MRVVDEVSENMGMTCEEFAIAGLDLGPAELDVPLQKAAREHLRECPHCAALHENWLGLREDLRALGAETAEVETPSRMEPRYGSGTLLHILLGELAYASERESGQHPIE